MTTVSTSGVGLMHPNPLRSIPAVNELVEQPALRELAERLGHAVIVNYARQHLDGVREALRRAPGEAALPDVATLTTGVAEAIAVGETSSLRPVINCTGVLLHTGLGRAPLAEEAIEAMTEAARDYASVEVDLDSGQRSQRVVAVEGLLCELTGAEAAVVTNNNAGATMLALAATAAGREVIVSRGELIEIGGSFRLPDVMATSGAKLREVGTTNKTRIGDYRAAIGPDTGALMRAHPSNFVVVGFTEHASLEQLVGLGREHGLTVIDDIGSGALIDFEQFGFSGEPVASKSIAAGADVVLFSGDKLLGGPQCGIAVGRREAIGRLAKHPMMRALRIDKLTLAALAATLRLYRDPTVALARIPLLAMLSASADSLRERAEAMSDALAAGSEIAEVRAIEDESFLGGGSIPTQRLSTWCVAIRPHGSSVGELASALRKGSPAVFARVRNDWLLLDLRSVPNRLDAAIVGAVRNALTRVASKSP
ncbi:MAG: L-seryl-tRNA(Sec) selenium transferase [Pirellulales bacterium]